VIKSAVTISLVPEARGGPFVFWDDEQSACDQAASIGFDAVEIFAPGREALAISTLSPMLRDFGLGLAAAGTGAGWVKHKLTLTDPDRLVRQRALDFIRSIIDAGGVMHAPAIIGSMQGRCSDSVPREAALDYLARALDTLGKHAASYNVPLLFEPLNRYETNLVNTLEAGAELLRSLATKNVRLLADLFHMNIEEADVATALRSAGHLLGHLHFADSNRRPVGLGHTDMSPVVASLKHIGYDGYASAECFPYPDPDGAARQTMEAFRKYFR
jgi:sugar phosphate isomerase/epimerase